MKLLFKTLLLLLVVALVACGEDYSDEKKAAQLEFDDYISQLGIDESFHLESGVYLIPRVDGTGALPKAGDELVVSFSIYELDSTFVTSNINVTNKQEIILMDNSFLTGYELPIAVRGLHEGLLKMREGETATLIIPFSLALEHRKSSTYGLPRFSSLRYELTLINIDETVFE